MFSLFIRNALDSHQRSMESWISQHNWINSQPRSNQPDHLLENGLKHQGVLGVKKTEGYITRVLPQSLYFIPKGGRKERAMMTYYSSFIMVVEGWRKPTPKSGIETMSAPNSRGKSLPNVPHGENVVDFLKGVGKNLRPIVLYQNERLKINKTDLPTSK